MVSRIRSILDLIVKENGEDDLNGLPNFNSLVPHWTYLFPALEPILYQYYHLSLHHSFACLRRWPSLRSSWNHVSSLSLSRAQKLCLLYICYHIMFSYIHTIVCNMDLDEKFRVVVSEVSSPFQTARRIARDVSDSWLTNSGPTMTSSSTVVASGGYINTMNIFSCNNTRIPPYLKPPCR